jgi:hypothetical protein
MRCVVCDSSAISERPDLTAQGYRRFRCRTCGKQFNERSAGLLNRTQYPSDVVALVVLWRLRYKLSLRESFDELRNFLRPRSNRNQHVPASHRRFHILSRSLTVISILMAA